MKKHIHKKSQKKSVQPLVRVGLFAATVTLSLVALAVFGIATDGLLGSALDHAAAASKSTSSGTSGTTPPAPTTLYKVSSESSFPLSVEGNIISEPSLVDLDGDGEREILLATDAGNIYALTSEGKNYAPPQTAASSVVSASWPIRLDVPNKILRISPTPVQLDKDPELEILVGSLGNDREPDMLAYLFALDDTGQILWQKECGLGCSAPAIVDVDNDGIDEIFTAASSIDWLTSRVYALKANGESLPGAWPYDVPFLDAMVAVADIDHNGTIEVIASSIGRISVMSLEGVFAPNWPQIGTYPAIGNMDDDAEDEVVTFMRKPRIHKAAGVTLAQVGPFDDYVYDLYIFNKDGWGNAVPLYDIHTLENAGFGNYAPIVADVVGNSDLEIIVTDFETGELIVLNKDGSIADNWPRSDAYYQYVIPVEIDGDGKAELLAITKKNNRTRLTMLDGDGGVLPGFPIALPAVSAQPMVADVDADGSIEVIVPLKTTNGNGSVAMFQISQPPLVQSSGGSRSVWPMWGGSQHRIFQFELSGLGVPADDLEF